MNQPQETKEGWKEVMIPKIIDILSHQKSITDQGSYYTGEKDWALNKILDLLHQTEQRVAREKQKDLATEFLYSNPMTKDGFPDSNITIGVEFEVGGKYEDWGFVINRCDKKIAEGRTLAEAIENARKRF